MCRRSVTRVGSVIARRGGRVAIVAGCVLVIAIPLVVALVALHGTRFDPPWDDALTELRVRDITAGHLDLVGFYSRFSALGRHGSHPGPAMFILFAPWYWLFGSTPWALVAAAAVLHLTAVVLILWMAGRRAGTAGTIAAAAAVGVLMHALGPVVVTRPWNPYFPLLWYVAVLVAVWSVLDGDVPMLVVLAFAGSVCVQAHNSYLGVVAALGLLAVGAAGTHAWRTPRDRGRVLGWAAVAVAVAAVVWLPPIIEQLTHSPGNFGVMWRYFLHPDVPHVGLHAATDTVLVQLNPWRIATGQIFFEQLRIQGSTGPGIVTLLVWLASFVAAQRRSVPRTLRTFQWTVAVALVVGWLSVSRIPGGLFWYLVLWGWVHSVCVLVAIAATAVTLARPLVAGRSARGARRFVPALVGIAALVGVAAVAGLTADAADATLGAPDPVLDRALPPVLRALHGVDRHRPVIVVWSERTVGGPGREMVNELARRGYDVGAQHQYSTQVTPFHTARPSADAVVVVLAGPGERARWSARPGVRSLGVIPRPPAGPVEVFIAPGRVLH